MIFYKKIYISLKKFIRLSWDQIKDNKSYANEASYAIRAIEGIRPRDHPTDPIDLF